MSRVLQRVAVALIIGSLAVALAPAQGNNGIIISEVVFGPSIAPGFPSYVELVNVRIANPVVPPPVQIGIPPMNPATLVATVNNQPPIVIQLPFVLVGGNVQPGPAPQPPTPPANPPVLVISSATFPAGTLPANVIPIVAPTFFSGPNFLLGAPGVSFELCFFNPATGQGDRLRLGPSAILSCAASSFTNTNTFLPNTGKAIRWCYVDSNTDIDFDPNLNASPGIVNLEMTHVNGFFFGTPTSVPFAGVDLQIAGSPTGGMLSFPPIARVKSVQFLNSFFDKRISNPAFDPVINAPVTMNANFIAQNPAISQPGFLPGLQIINESMTIMTSSAAGTGTLDMPMGLSTQVGTSIASPPGSPSNIRPERIFTDNISDAAPFQLGLGTAVTIDVIPPSTGGGNTWCEIIVYDYAGNQYRAKVKNWPAGDTCGGPLLALGTDNMGSFTIIDLCFTPGALIANLFSGTPAGSCGGPLFPAGGICPDALTAWIITPPQLGAPPFFVTADASGMYLFQAPSGSIPPGITIDGIGIEYTLAGMIVQQSAVNTITF